MIGLFTITPVPPIANPLSPFVLNIELWWENWRRQDMIRFGKYLKPFQEKKDQSDPKYLKFPIPYEQLAVNPNLAQNNDY